MKMKMKMSPRPRWIHASKATIESLQLPMVMLGLKVRAVMTSWM